MKKFFSKLMKDTRGVVMMEYVVLGCFAVAVTVVAVLALGKAYNNGLATMASATAGETVDAAAILDASKDAVRADFTKANDYGTQFESQNVGISGFTYEVYQ